MTVWTKVDGFEACGRALADLKTATARAVGRRSLLPAAEHLKTKAAAAAPELTGDYKGSYSVDRSPKARRKSAAEVHVRADDVGAAAIEYGTTDTPAFGTFARTADAETDAMVKLVGDALLVETDKAVARAEAKAAKG